MWKSLIAKMLENEDLFMILELYTKVWFCFSFVSISGYSFKSGKHDNITLTCTGFLHKQKS